MRPQDKHIHMLILATETENAGPVVPGPRQSLLAAIFIVILQLFQFNEALQKPDEDLNH